MKHSQPIPLPWILRVGWLRPLRRLVRYTLARTYLGLWKTGVPVSEKLLLHHPMDRKVMRQMTEKTTPRLLAVYDLSVYPLSFDFIYFLAYASHECTARELSTFDIAVLSHKSDPIQDDPGVQNPIATGDLRTFIYNLIIESTGLFENVGNLLWFSDRNGLDKYLKEVADHHSVVPPGYQPARPDTGLSNEAPPYYGLVHILEDAKASDEISNLRAPEESRRLARHWLASKGDGGTVITVTLRETTHRPERNSNIEEWKRLVEHYDDRGITFVVLNDYFNLYSDPVIYGPHVVACPEAVLSVSFRAALYEIADLNLFVNGGPASLCYLNFRANYLVFMEIGDFEDRDWPATEFQHGLKPGVELPGSTPLRHICWCPDNFEDMKRELDAALARMDGAGTADGNT